MQKGQYLKQKKARNINRAVYELRSAKKVQQVPIKPQIFLLGTLHINSVLFVINELHRL